MKWLNEARILSNGQKNPPEQSNANLRSEIPTGNGQKTLPGERSEKPTDIEIKQRNKTLKQKEPEVAASLEVLKAAGFDGSAAGAIATRYPFERIDRQIRWMGGRRALRNRLGMLRKAIEGDWARPEFAASRREELGQPNLPEATATFEETIRRIERRLSDSSTTS